MFKLVLLCLMVTVTLGFTDGKPTLKYLLKKPFIAAHNLMQMKHQLIQRKLASGGLMLYNVFDGFHNKPHFSTHFVPQLTVQQQVPVQPQMPVQPQPQVQPVHQFIRPVIQPVIRPVLQPVFYQVHTPVRPVVHESFVQQVQEAPTPVFNKPHFNKPHFNKPQFNKPNIHGIISTKIQGLLNKKQQLHQLFKKPSKLPVNPATEQGINMVPEMADMDMNIADGEAIIVVPGPIVPIAPAGQNVPASNVAIAGSFSVSNVGTQVKMPVAEVPAPSHPAVQSTGTQTDKVSNDNAYVIVNPVVSAENVAGEIETQEELQHVPAEADIYEYVPESEVVNSQPSLVDHRITAEETENNNEATVDEKINLVAETENQPKNNEQVQVSEENKTPVQTVTEEKVNTVSESNTQNKEQSSSSTS